MGPPLFLKSKLRACVSGSLKLGIDLENSQENALLLMGRAEEWNWSLVPLVAAQPIGLVDGEGGGKEDRYDNESCVAIKVRNYGSQNELSLPKMFYRNVISSVIIIAYIIPHSKITLENFRIRRMGVCGYSEASLMVYNARGKIMTLIITVIEKDHIWQSSDHRITKINGDLFDDKSIKHIHLNCTDGKALLSWTGLAELKDKTRLNVWLKDVLRPGIGSVEETLKMISDRATLDIGGTFELVVCVGAFINDQAWYYEITNFVGEPGKEKLKNKFVTKKTKADKDGFFPGGSGRIGLTKKDINTLKSAAKKAIKNPDVFAKALSSVNKKISATVKTVSPTCTTAYISSTGGITTEIHTNEEREDFVYVVPTSV